MGERGPCYCANHGDCHYECRETAPLTEAEIGRAIEGLRAAVEQQAEIERLRAGLMKSVQYENSCEPTGRSCREGEPCARQKEAEAWLE